VITKQAVRLDSPEGLQRAVPAVDVLGIGFGPSNLSLGIALSETFFSDAIVFLEKQKAFAWHRDMLIADATMQVSFLKDLATCRNPQSSFTFINYLKSKGRLADFINLKTFYPTRIEFHDYLEWCALHFVDAVRYGCAVKRIEPVEDQSGQVRWLRVFASDNEGLVEKVYLARSIVCATGLTPKFPANASEGPRVWHSQALKRKIRGISENAKVRFAVVGSGQSAAEIVDYLLTRFPNADVHAICSRYGYMPADDSPFVNQIFDPEAVDIFYNASRSTKREVLRLHAQTNYGAVDLDLIQRLYHRWYHDRLEGSHRFCFHRLSRLEKYSELPDDVLLQLDSGAEGSSTLRVDYLIFASGYNIVCPSHLFAPELREMCLRDDEGTLEIGRDHRVATSAKLTAPIFVNGGQEQTHGLSATLISNMAVRSGELAESLRTQLSAHAAGYSYGIKM
jgi:L-ornithine N5-oxygenase